MRRLAGFDKNIIVLVFLLCLGCNSKPRVNLGHVSLTKNKTSVIFTGLNKAVINEIGRDTSADIWENLLPVYRMPADTDLKNYQPVQQGKYQLQDSSVIFTPDTPFEKNRPYFMRYYHFDEGGKTWDLITGKKPVGASHYIDLIFKP